MYVVTGGAGFIGSVLVAALNRRNTDDIVVSDWLGCDDRWRNLAKRSLADIVPPQNLLPYLEANGKQVTAVIHMGAISATTETDGDLILERNFKPTLALWKWCTRNSVPFLYASSAATYGDGSHGFDDDNSLAALSRLRPLNLYGWSKQVFDLRAVTLAERGEHPPQWAGLKFFNVFGPNEYHKGSMQSVISKIYTNISSDRPVQLFKSHRSEFVDGGQLRDFIWVEDIVDVILWLLDNPEVSGIFNVGTGTARSFFDLATATFNATDRKPDIQYIDMPEVLRSKYQYYTQASMDRLRNAGYSAQFTSLEVAINRYVRNYMATEDRYI